MLDVFSSTKVNSIIDVSFDFSWLICKMNILRLNFISPTFEKTTFELFQKARTSYFFFDDEITIKPIDQWTGLKTRCIHSIHIQEDDAKYFESIEKDK